MSKKPTMYTKKGVQKAMKSMEERTEKKGYSKDEIEMAMSMRKK